MMTLHFLYDVANDAESTQKSIITSYSLVWRVNQPGKLINRNHLCVPGSHLLKSIQFPRLGFENSCWIALQASRCQQMARQAPLCQQVFSKPCLVNFISKDTHLVFSISGAYHIMYIKWKIHDCIPFPPYGWLKYGSCQPLMKVCIHLFLRNHLRATCQGPVYYDNYGWKNDNRPPKNKISLNNSHQHQNLHCELNWLLN